MYSRATVAVIAAFARNDPLAPRESYRAAPPRRPATPPTPLKAPWNRAFAAAWGRGGSGLAESGPFVWVRRRVMGTL